MALKYILLFLNFQSQQFLLKIHLEHVTNLSHKSELKFMFYV